MWKGQNKHSPPPHTMCVPIKSSSIFSTRICCFRNSNCPSSFVDDSACLLHFTTTNQFNLISSTQHTCSTGPLCCLEQSHSIKSFLHLLLFMNFKCGCVSESKTTPSEQLYIRDFKITLVRLQRTLYSSETIKIQPKNIFSYKVEVGRKEFFSLQKFLATDILHYKIWLNAKCQYSIHNLNQLCFLVHYRKSLVRAQT